MLRVPHIRYLMGQPEDFIVKFLELVPQGARVLDVASGKGRHALLLARRGCTVLAMEGNPEFVRHLRNMAQAEGLSLEVIEADVENMSLLSAGFDVVINTLFLYRPLFRDYVTALRPAGLLFFRTFTTNNSDVLGHVRPRREYLLKPGELRRAFFDLKVIHYEESVVQDRAMATLVARR